MDLYQRMGGYPVPPGAPSILGVEFSGRVDEVGPGVTKISLGNEVFGLAGGVSTPGSTLKRSTVLMIIQGAYAEYIAVNQGLLMKKPAHLTWVEAASIPENYITGVSYGKQLSWRRIFQVSRSPDRRRTVFQPIKLSSDMVK